MTNIAETFEIYKDRFFSREDILRKNTEYSAESQEVQWQKGVQFQRALAHANNGIATPSELAYLYRKSGKIYPGTKKALKAEIYLGPPEPVKMK